MNSRSVTKSIKCLLVNRRTLSVEHRFCFSSNIANRVESVNGMEKYAGDFMLESVPLESNFVSAGFFDFLSVFKTVPEAFVITLCGLTGSIPLSIILGTLVLRLAILPINFYSVVLKVHPGRETEASHAEDPASTYVIQTRQVGGNHDDAGLCSNPKKNI